MVAHHEVIALRHDRGSEIIVAAVLRRHEVVLHWHVIHEHAAVDDANLIAFLGNHALDERLVRVERVVEHDDVAASRDAPAICQLIDDEPVLVRERWGHALAFDTRDLKAKRDDERCVNGCRRECFHPGNGLVLPDVEAMKDRTGTVVNNQLDLRLDNPLDELRVRCQRRLERRRQSFRYSRSRLVCVRLTGISVPFASFIRRM
jgi:hypothetical protein